MSRAHDVITRGALNTIFSQGQDPDFQPVMQCLQVKPMAAKDAQERYRVILSDVDNFIQAMLATQSNYLVTQGILKKNCVLRLTSYNPNVVKDKKILIIMDAEVLTEYGEPEKIGEPVNLVPAQQPQQQQQQQHQAAAPAPISGGNFYGNRPVIKPEYGQQHQPVSALPSRPVAPTHEGVIHPIEAISPYNHRWTIKARVTSRAPERTWQNDRGGGKILSVNLMDETGEIRATAFSSMGDTYDHLFNILQEGGVYYISSPCQVKLAKKQFSNLNNDYELTFEAATKVEKAEDASNVPMVRYNFTSLGDLNSVENNNSIDTIGILKEVGELSQIIAKSTQKTYDKRDLTIADQSGFQVRLTVWGNTAQSFDAPIDSVLAFKGAKVSDYNGKSLSLLSSGSMTVDPDIDEAHKLKGWYDAQGRGETFTSHAGTGTMSRNDPFKTIEQVQAETGDLGDQPVYFTLKATVTIAHSKNPYYPACPTDRCNKKVIQTEVGPPAEWRCESCDKSFPAPVYRYILTIYVLDHTGPMWLSTFDEAGRVIMGRPAEELEQIKELGEEGDAQLNQAFQDAAGKTYIFRCRAKMDTFGDTPRVKYSVLSLTPMNYTAEISKLTDLMKEYTLQNQQNDSLFVQ